MYSFILFTALFSCLKGISDFGWLAVVLWLVEIEQDAALLTFSSLWPRITDGILLWVQPIWGACYLSAAYWYIVKERPFSELQGKSSE